MPDKRIDTEGNVNWYRFVEQGTHPTADSSGYWRLYFMSSGVYAKSDAGKVVGPLSGLEDGVYSSRSAAGLESRLFFPSDAPIIEHDDGSGWKTHGPLYHFTPPDLSDFVWLNQGDATAVEEYGCVYMECPKPAVQAYNLRVIKKAIPSAPYKIDMAVTPLVASGSSYAKIGIILRNSISGLAVGLHLQSYTTNQGAISSYKWPNLTSTPIAYDSDTRHFIGNWNPIFIRMEDDGTQRKCSYSPDGIHWMLYHWVSNTDYIVPDECGFFIDNFQTSYEFSAIVHSWKES